MGSDTDVFRETDIRPDNLMRGQVERFAVDIKRLLERKTDFVNVDCPACGQGCACLQFIKYEMNYLTCSACETLYISPRPTPSILSDYYSNSENYNYWNKHIFPASEQMRREKIFRPRALRVEEIVRRMKTSRKTLVEVGAGFGIFCEEITAIKLFDRVIGIEPTPDLAATCRLKKIEVIEQSIESVSLPNQSIDVIASFEVIEHLFSPEKFIRWCADVLVPGGLLVLTCPNVKGFEVAILQEVSDTVDVEHLNYFHPDSLMTLIKRCGLDLVEITTPGKLDVDIVRRKVAEKKIDLTSQPFIKHIVSERSDSLGERFQQFLAENGLSSHMWLVARKSLIASD